MIINGDCLPQLRLLEENSVDLIVTDPPYGYSFMGKDWDKAVPSVEIWKECLRVLKPGGFAFIMSAPRSDVLSRMIVRIEDAGFRVDFSPIYWTYASGFPKAMNIGKMVDKRMGVQGEVVGQGHAGAGMNKVKGFGQNTTKGGEATTQWDVRAVASDEGKKLNGSYGGFQPKPAVEVIIVAMKPLSEKTYVDQALQNGKGITWLDDCRVPTEDSTHRHNKPYSNGDVYNAGQWGEYTTGSDVGRFPANLLVEDDILGDYSRFFSLDKWAENLPFLAVPKASKREKNEGLEDFPAREGGVKNASGRGYSETDPNRPVITKNAHPTVKPLTLMSYLITLGSREGDTVLDPFVGSGTTAVAAAQLNRKCIGIEREQEYADIALARVRNIQPPLAA